MEGYVTGGRRRRKQLLDDLKEKIGCSKLKEEAPDRTLRSTGFVRDYRPVVRQYVMNELTINCAYLCARVCERERESDVLNYTVSSSEYVVYAYNSIQRVP
jgi:hypothetical protein